MDHVNSRVIRGVRSRYAEPAAKRRVTTTLRSRKSRRVAISSDAERRTDLRWAVPATNKHCASPLLCSLQRAKMVDASKQRSPRDTACRKPGSKSAPSRIQIRTQRRLLLQMENSLSPLGSKDRKQMDADFRSSGLFENLALDHVLSSQIVSGTGQYSWA